MDAPTIHALTVLLFATWERRHRDWLAWRYRDRVESRARAVKAVEEAQRLERERLEAARRALQQRRIRLLLRAVEGVKRAQEIRMFVAELVEIAAAQEGDGEGLAWWSTLALGQADALDLRAQPVPAVAQWVAAFELEAENDPKGPTRAFTSPRGGGPARALERTMNHPVIQRFEAQAELLEARGSRESLDEAVVRLAAWIGLAQDRLTEDDMAVLMEIGGILYREGLRRKPR